MVYGRCWSFVGSIDRASGQVPKLYFNAWKGLRRCRGHLLTWMKLWRQTLMNGRMPRRAVPVCFPFQLLSLRLTPNHPCGIVGPTITRSGNGLLVPSRSLRRRATPAYNKIPPPQYNSHAHPDRSLDITELPVPPGSYPPGITSSAVIPDDGKLPATSRQGGSKGGCNRRVRSAWDMFRTTSKGLCGL